MVDVKPEFAEWARSFSGCDGGDPKSEFWLCGIEWGFGKGIGQSEQEYEESARKYYEVDLPKEIERGKYEPTNSNSWSECLKYTYGRTSAKLFMALNGLNIDQYSGIASAGIPPPLRLNLYPISFRHTSYDLWNRYGLTERTGLSSKEAYRTWCFVNRFSFFADAVKANRPKLIIGTGLSCLVDFFVCFGGMDACGNIFTEELTTTSENSRSVRKFYWSRINSGQTVLAVVPFFSGQSGLNSTALIQQLGSRLADIIR